MHRFLIIIPSVIIFYVVFVNLYKIKISKAELAVSVVVACAISYSVYFYLPNEALVYFFLIVILSTLAFRQNKSIPLSLFFTTLTSITFMLAGSITTLFFTYLSNGFFVGKNSEFATDVASALLNLAITFTISRVLGNFLNKKLGAFSNEQKRQFARYVLWGTVLTLFIFYVNMFVFRVTGDIALIQAVNAVLLVLYFVFLIAAAYTFVESVKNQMELKHRQDLLTNFNSYTASLESMFTEIRRFKHDYINILTPFYEYIESGDIDGVKKYYDENVLPVKGLLDVLNKAIDRLKFIKIPEFKGLLSVKLMYAQELDINTIVDISEEIDQIPVYPADLCRIAGALIDNAIEECCECDEPTLKLSVLNKDGGTVFICANTYVEPPPISKMFEKGYTTKGERRGFGLYSLKAVVDANSNMSLMTEIENGFLIQELVIAAAVE